MLLFLKDSGVSSEIDWNEREAESITQPDESEETNYFRNIFRPFRPFPQFQPRGNPIVNRQMLFCI